VVVGRPHFKNDVGYADAFANRYRGRIKFIAEEEVWLLFDNERGWHRDKSGEALALCTEYSRELYEQALTEARNAEDQQAGANRVREAAKLGDSKRIKPALEFAKVSKEIRISVHDIDQDPHLLGVTNGVVDLRDGSDVTRLI
jgi:phage/plasmid-associated DNA primase